MSSHTPKMIHLLLRDVLIKLKICMDRDFCNVDTEFINKIQNVQMLNVFHREIDNNKYWIYVWNAC